MIFTRLSISDVIAIEPRVYGDHRGFFMETWQKKIFEESGICDEFVQDNHSLSARGTLRGLHYQIQRPQGKLVRVVQGEIYDVAVDLRISSSTFGKWIGERLSSQNKKMLWLPPGFAHGFYVISETAEVVYKATDYYAPNDERCILWNDPTLGVYWPLTAPPLLSEKDARGVSFHRAEYYK